MGCLSWTCSWLPVGWSNHKAGDQPKGSAPTWDRLQQGSSSGGAKKIGFMQVVFSEVVSLWVKQQTGNFIGQGKQLGFICVAKFTWAYRKQQMCREGYLRDSWWSNEAYCHGLVGVKTSLTAKWACIIQGFICSSSVLVSSGLMSDEKAFLFNLLMGKEIEADFFAFYTALRSCLWWLNWLNGRRPNSYSILSSIFQRFGEANAGKELGANVELCFSVSDDFLEEVEAISVKPRPRLWASFSSRDGRCLWSPSSVLQNVCVFPSPLMPGLL